MEDLRFENQKIIDVDINKEMQRSFIDYAMSVIVARALPDVRDGLKPVHRRILYAMHEDNLTHDRPYRKSATTVGNVLGRYHPHGDAAVYDALVRMAQSFSLRYPMIDGQGNFGSVDGDPPAAYRYTEARMSRMAGEMLSDIEKDTVDFVPNYDDKLREPSVLPARFPGLLVNGSSGIAVGMATNIPPHNLRETIDAVCCLIDDPEAPLEALMEHLQGPDFPTGGIIMGRGGIRAAYLTGRGKLTVRARAEIEEHNGRARIVVTELPYMVNKARLLEHIAELHKEKRVEGISDLRDESDRTGMRMVIELRRDANAAVTLNQLFRHTQMQDTFSVNMLALDKGQPKVMPLRDMLRAYLDHQFEVVTRRCNFELKKARERAHILEGLVIACDNIDEVIRIIRSSYDDARERLCERFALSEVQAQAILDMRLGRLQGLEREKLQAELDALHARIAELLEILADPARVYAIVREELQQIRDRFGDDRRTEISVVEDETEDEDLIPEQSCVYTLSAQGYIKRQPVSTFRAQRRGGRGVTGMTTRDEDMVDTLFTASTHDHILFFTSRGRVLRVKGYRIPESSRTSRGTHLANLLPLEGEERVSAMLHTAEFDDSHFVVLVTRAGTIKRLALSALQSARRAGVRAITLADDDELAAAFMTGGEDHILVATRQGQAVRFPEEEVRAMGREAAGVRAIRLGEDDWVVGAACTPQGGYVLTVTERGYGKLTEPQAFTAHHRGGSGMTAHALTEKTGALAAMRVVTLAEDLLLMTSQGVLIRSACDQIRVCGRASQGVILVRLPEGTSVIAAAGCEREEAEEADAAENG